MRYEDENIWLTQKMITTLYDVGLPKINEHIKKIYADGEFRRATWHLDFMWGFDVIGHAPTKTGLPFHGEAAMIDDLYAAGCRNIQLDDCTWGMFADKIGHTLYGTTKESIIQFQISHKDINNRVIANAPKDMVINTHVCRGNFHSTYASEGGI